MGKLNGFNCEPAPRRGATRFPQNSNFSEFNSFPVRETFRRLERAIKINFPRWNNAEMRILSASALDGA